LPFLISFTAIIARKRPELNRDKTSFRNVMFDQEGKVEPVKIAFTRQMFVPFFNKVHVCRSINNRLHFL